MAIVVRYFSTSAAGAGDGTTWADRAALFTTGNWSSVITGFAFNGSDSLECRIGPGTYTCSQTLASGLFANPPTVANPLTLHGCDSSGNRLAPSNPGWQSAQPVDWDSGLPVIATTTNIATVNLGTINLRLLKFTSSGTTTNPTISAIGVIDWCILDHSGSNTSAYGIAGGGSVNNSSVSMSGASYRAGALLGTGSYFYNSRLVGVTGSSGNRHGLEFSGGAGAEVAYCTIYAFGGDGIGTSSSTASHYYVAHHSVLANNGGAGAKCNGTATQTDWHVIAHCMITGNGAYGIDGNTNAGLIAVNNRLRDNTSGNFGNAGNQSTTYDNYVTDSDDATDYADAASYDFRTAKENAALWNKGYGMDEPNTAAGGVDLPDVMMVGA